MRGTRRLAAACAAAVLLAIWGPADERASAAGALGDTDVADHRPPPTTQPTRVPDGFPETPDGYEISARQALLAADLDREIRDRKGELGWESRELTALIDAEPGTVWEVGYHLDGEKVNLVLVDGRTGEVRESWTGAAVAWPMARGRSGQFGHLLNSPWVWGTLAAIFLLGLWDFRRWRRWAHLDLLVLLSFGVSQAFFNAAEIGLSVPLAYPPLAYLLARMLWIGFRGGRGERPGALRPSAPTWLLLSAVVGLIVLRLLANAVDSGVIDVGYASVVGADRITHAEPIYDDSFPEDVPHGDTYGPANYFAYVPFELALPWSGSWDELPAAHAAAGFFDLAAVLGLFALGLATATRSRGRLAARPRPRPGLAGRAASARSALRGALASPGGRLGSILAFAWLAYPYTALVSQSNSNDSLLAALLIWSLVAFASPTARGVLLAAAALTKFAPLALLPLYAAGERGIHGGLAALRTRIRPLSVFAVAFLAFGALLLAYPAVDPGLTDFYERALGSQLDRESPFSIWGQTDLEWLQTLVKGAVLLLGIAVAFVPRERSLVQVAALSAALLIGVQMTLEHWFYLYLPWFFGALIFALAARQTRGAAGTQPASR